jgi:hypothetical protein
MEKLQYRIQTLSMHVCMKRDNRSEFSPVMSHISYDVRAVWVRLSSGGPVRDGSDSSSDAQIATDAFYS